jgi:hypothetical protein
MEEAAGDRLTPICYVNYSSKVLCFIQDFTSTQQSYISIFTLPIVITMI